MPAYKWTKCTVCPASWKANGICNRCDNGVPAPAVSERQCVVSCSNRSGKGKGGSSASLMSDGEATQGVSRFESRSDSSHLAPAPTTTISPLSLPSPAVRKQMLPPSGQHWNGNKSIYIAYPQDYLLNHDLYGSKEVIGCIICDSLSQLVDEHGDWEFYLEDFLKKQYELTGEVYMAIYAGGSALKYPTKAGSYYAELLQYVPKCGLDFLLIYCSGNDLYSWDQVRRWDDDWLTEADLLCETGKDFAKHVMFGFGASSLAWKYNETIGIFSSCKRYDDSVAYLVEELKGKGHRAFSGAKQLEGVVLGDRIGHISTASRQQLYSAITLWLEALRVGQDDMLADKPQRRFGFVPLGRGEFTDREAELMRQDMIVDEPKDFDTWWTESENKDWWSDLTWDAVAQCLLVQLCRWQKEGYRIPSNLKLRALEDCMQQHEYKAPRLGSNSWSHQLEAVLQWYADKLKLVGRHPCTTCGGEGNVVKVPKLCNVFECRSCERVRLDNLRAKMYTNPDYNVDEVMAEFWVTMEEDAKATIASAAIDNNVDPADVAPAHDDVGGTGQRLDSPSTQESVCADSAESSMPPLEPSIDEWQRQQPHVVGNDDDDLFGHVPEAPSDLHHKGLRTGDGPASYDVDPMFADYKDFIFSDQLLGRGSFGRVYKAAQVSSNETVDIKKEDKATANAERLPGQLGEWQVNVMLKHKNIVAFHGYWFEENTNCMVFEYCNKGSLHQYIRGAHYDYEKTSVDLIFPQILSGVAHMHQHGVVHRDIKPENILLSQAKLIDDPDISNKVLPLQVKIGDFGCAFLCGPHQAVKARGTLLRRSPEMLLWGGNWSGDMWALGLVLWELMFEDPLMQRNCIATYDEEGCLEFIRGSFFANEVKLGYASAKEWCFPYHMLLASLLELQWQQRPTAVDALAFCSQSFESAHVGGEISDTLLTGFPNVYDGRGPPPYVPHPWLVDYHAESKQFVYYRDDDSQMGVFTFAPPPCAPLPWDVRWCNNTKRFYRELHNVYEEDWWSVFDEYLYGGQELKQQVQRARQLVDPNLYHHNKKEWEASINLILFEDDHEGGSLTMKATEKFCIASEGSENEEEEEEASSIADSDYQSFKIKWSSSDNALVG